MFFRKLFGRKRDPLPRSNLHMKINRCTFIKAGSISSSFFVPDGIFRIADYAFSRRDELVYVTLPSSLNSIGVRAFELCRNLCCIHMPDSVYTIEEYAFVACTSVERIELPDTLKQIEKGVFCNCTSLKEITLPANLVSIGENAFYGCSSLREIRLPDSVTQIGNGAFRDCPNLRKITLPKNLVSIGSEAFSKCTSLEEICIPGGTMQIGKDAFRDCPNLRKITLPENLVSIGSEAFLPGIPEIDAAVLSPGETPRKIIIPRNMRRIRMDALRTPGNLPNIHTRIVFQDVPPEQYGEMEHIHVPEGTQRIEDYAFAGRMDIESAVLPEGLAEIGAYAFYLCANLKEINIPRSVTLIHPCAFAGCVSLENLSFPNGLVNISAKAFENCKSLREIRLSMNTKLQYAAFRGCGSLTRINGGNSFRGFIWKGGCLHQKFTNFRIYSFEDAAYALSFDADYNYDTKKLTTYGGSLVFHRLMEALARIYNQKPFEIDMVYYDSAGFDSSCLRPYYEDFLKLSDRDKAACVRETYKRLRNEWINGYEPDEDDDVLQEMDQQEFENDRFRAQDQADEMLLRMNETKDNFQDLFFHAYIYNAMYLLGLAACLRFRESDKEKDE